MGYIKNGDTISSRLSNGREAFQFEMYFRVLGYLLFSWCNFKKNELTEKTANALPSISFDKLAVFSFRIWNYLYNQTTGGAKTLFDSLPATDSNMVRFPSPFVPIPGKHGKGHGRPNGKDGKAIYLIEIVHELRQDNLIPYFEIRTPDDAKDKANDHRTVVTPTYPITNFEDFFDIFDSVEKEVVRDLANIIKRLSVEHLRAIGTHSDYKNTIDDIQFEFRKFERARNEAIQKIRHGEPFHIIATEMLEFANEAFRKSKSNREAYEKALQIIHQETTSDLVNNAISQCQHSSAQIWDHNKMQVLADRAEMAERVSGYLSALAALMGFGTDTASNKKSSRDKSTKTLADVASWMRGKGYKQLPANLSEILVDGKADIKPEVCDLLVSVLDSI